jgi:hypothetical protein
LVLSVSIGKGNTCHDRTSASVRSARRRSSPSLPQAAVAHPRKSHRCHAEQSSPFSRSRSRDSSPECILSRSKELRMTLRQRSPEGEGKKFKIRKQGDHRTCDWQTLRPNRFTGYRFARCRGQARSPAWRASSERTRCDRELFPGSPRNRDKSPV